MTGDRTAAVNLARALAEPVASRGERESGARHHRRKPINQ